jgi:hypothetical protein
VKPDFFIWPLNENPRRSLEVLLRAQMEKNRLRNFFIQFLVSGALLWITLVIPHSPHKKSWLRDFFMPFFLGQVSSNMGMMLYMIFLAKFIQTANLVSNTGKTTAYPSFHQLKKM